MHNANHYEIDNLETDHRFGTNGSPVRSCLVIPLIYRNELLGVLNVESPRHAAYDDNSQEMIGTLCGTLAAIIANTRLIERQRLLFDVTSKIRRSVSMQNILETTVTELSSSFRRAEGPDLGWFAICPTLSYQQSTYGNQTPTSG